MSKYSSSFEEAWEIQNDNFTKLVERVEDYPCCMSCYLTVEELNAAKQMKESILKILKGEI